MAETAPLRAAQAARADEAGKTLHSFSTLLDELAALTRNVIVFTNGARITKLAIPTPLQRRAFELVGVPVPIELKAMQTEPNTRGLQNPLLSRGFSRQGSGNFGLRRCRRR